MLNHKKGTVCNFKKKKKARIPKDKNKMAKGLQKSLRVIRMSLKSSVIFSCNYLLIDSHGNFCHLRHHSFAFTEFSHSTEYYYQFD